MYVYISRWENKKKMWCTHGGGGEYSAANTKNKILPFATNWKVLPEVKKLDKDKYCMISLMKLDFVFFSEI